MGAKISLLLLIASRHPATSSSAGHGGNGGLGVSRKRRASALTVVGAPIARAGSSRRPDCSSFAMSQFWSRSGAANGRSVSKLGLAFGERMLDARIGYHPQHGTEGIHSLRNPR